MLELKKYRIDYKKILLGIGLAGISSYALSQTNLALNKTVTASPRALLAVSNAVDGNPATRWESIHGSSPALFQVDLGSIQTVGAIQIDWEAANARNYEVLGSTNGVNWTPLTAVTGGGFGNRSDRLSVSGSYRYLKFNFASRSTGNYWGFSIWEIKVFGANATTETAKNLMQYAKATASEGSLRPAANAIDKGLSSNLTRWESAHGSDNAYLQIDLGANSNLHSLSIDWESANASQYKIFGLTELNQTPVEIANLTGGIFGDRNDFIAVQGLYRYVRVQGVSRSAGNHWGYSIYDVRIYGYPTTAHSSAGSSNKSNTSIFSSSRSSVITGISSISNSSSVNSARTSSSRSSMQVSSSSIASSVSSNSNTSSLNSITASSSHSSISSASNRPTSLEAAFGNLSQTFGSNPNFTASITSEPMVVNMRNGGTPGKAWLVRLGNTNFKISIEDSAATQGITIEQALRDVERLPEPYHKAFAIVSEADKDGVAYYSDLGGASAHGSQDYLNLALFSGWAIPHEAGHVLEQRARRAQPDILDNWAQAITRDQISVSGYGDNNTWEDLAEFAKIYAYCLDKGAQELNALKNYSPNRFAQWENILNTAVVDTPIASSSSIESSNSSVASSSSSNSSISSMSSSTVSSSGSSVNRSSASSLANTSSSRSSSAVSSDRNRYNAPKATNAPTIDGIAEDSWDRAAWAPIDIFWLGSQNPTAQDFSGRYKAMWDAEYLYLLFDITDDVILDATADPLERYWDDDCVEIFIDENKSGGNHQYNTSAWAYHISTLGDTVDFTNTRSPALLNQHIDVRKVSAGSKHMWEMRVRIFGENYTDTGTNTPLILSAGKLMGFSASYNDNDMSARRESMLGSVDTQGHKNDMGYIDASVFGTMLLTD